jgi:hypothetical protein
MTLHIELACAYTMMHFDLPDKHSTYEKTPVLVTNPLMELHLPIFKPVYSEGIQSLTVTDFITLLDCVLQLGDNA